MIEGLTLRPVSQDEYPLIVDSWVRSYSGFSSSDEPDAHRKSYNAQLPFNYMQQWLWFKMHRNMVKNLLDGSNVAVATLESVPDEVVGWICWQDPTDQFPLVVHYTFVKSHVRRYGVASKMMNMVLSRADERGFRSSHITRDGRAFMSGLGHTI